MTQSEKIMELNSKIEELEEKISSITTECKNIVNDFSKQFSTSLMEHREQIIKLETYVKKERERKVKAIAKLK